MGLISLQRIYSIGGYPWCQAFCLHVRVSVFYPTSTVDKVEKQKASSLHMGNVRPFLPIKRGLLDNHLSYRFVCMGLVASGILQGVYHRY